MSDNETAEVPGPRLVPAEPREAISFEDAFAQAMEDDRLRRFYDLTNPYPATPQERPLHQIRSSQILVPTDTYTALKDLEPAHARVIDTRCGIPTKTGKPCGGHVARSVGYHRPGQRWGLVTTLVWSDRGADPQLTAVRALSADYGPRRSGITERWAWTGRTDDALDDRHGAFFLDNPFVFGAHPRGHRSLKVHLPDIWHGFLPNRKMRGATVQFVER